MSEQMLQGENLALRVRAGQGCVEGLFLASSSSLFLRVACLAAKTLSKGGSTWVVSAAEISLANEGVCCSFRNKNKHVFHVCLCCFVHLVTFPVLQHLLSSYSAFLSSS